MAFNRSFDFDQGSLGRNLATFDDKVHDFISRDIDVHTAKGELELKTKAPWTDDTGHARETLWADNDKSNNRYSIHMGHGAEYGVYLEKSNGGRFQVIMPVLLATARSFMSSLEHMFAQMETHAPIGTAISPSIGTRPGTSQDAGDRIHITVDKRGRASGRNAKGRFVSLKNFIKSNATKATKRTRKG
jgi:hypothetical protein